MSVWKHEVEFLPIRSITYFWQFNVVGKLHGLSNTAWSTCSFPYPVWKYLGCFSGCFCAVYETIFAVMAAKGLRLTSKIAA